MGRVFEKLTIKNLEEIRNYALAELEKFLYTEPCKYEVYEKHLIAICLCQGAAQHYVDGLDINEFDNIFKVGESEITKLNDKMEGIKFDRGNLRTGIHDIDVWMFFKEDDTIKIPHRGNKKSTIEASLSGLGSLSFDFMKKTISEKVINQSSSLSPKDILESYLNNAETDSSEFLSQKSIVGLYPLEIFAEPIWRVKRIYENQ